MSHRLVEAHGVVDGMECCRGIAVLLLLLLLLLPRPLLLLALLLLLLLPAFMLVLGVVVLWCCDDGCGVLVVWCRSAAVLELLQDTGLLQQRRAAAVKRFGTFAGSQQEQQYADAGSTSSLGATGFSRPGMMQQQEQQCGTWNAGQAADAAAAAAAPAVAAVGPAAAGAVGAHGGGFGEAKGVSFEENKLRITELRRLLQLVSISRSGQPGVAAAMNMQHMQCNERLLLVPAAAPAALAGGPAVALLLITAWHCWRTLRLNPKPCWLLPVI
jgi:hypothetical protein